MLNRLRNALVESYVGTIVLGLIFAYSISHFIGILSMPLMRWVASMSASYSVMSKPAQFDIRQGLPELVQAILFFLIGYVLLRWLYYPSAKPEAPEPAPVEEAPAGPSPL